MSVQKAAELSKNVQTNVRRLRPLKSMGCENTIKAKVSVIRRIPTVLKARRKAVGQVDQGYRVAGGESVLKSRRSHRRSQVIVTTDEKR